MAGQRVQPVQPITSGDGRPISIAEAAPIELASGISAPVRGMVWILGQAEHAPAENKPRLLRIDPNVIHENGHRVENLVRAQGLVLKMSNTLELPDTSAKLRVSGRTPAIFIHESEREEEEVQTSNNAKSVHEHYVLLRLKDKGQHRLVGTVSCWQLGLKCGRHLDIVESSAEEIPGSQWLKIVPQQPLPDGEYAIVPLPDNPRQFDSTLYDFGIGPARQ